jgi:hypothetical protein
MALRVLVRSIATQAVSLQQPQNSVEEIHCDIVAASPGLFCFVSRNCDPQGWPVVTVDVGDGSRDPTASARVAATRPLPRSVFSNPSSATTVRTCVASQQHSINTRNHGLAMDWPVTAYLIVFRPNNNCG